ncbi:hypothetical protein TBLA_0E03230 [Henningerozyma blattae CBS 6284]|uniref:GB1/RHD3-type G domain-containing protein n=1 Tax=Henningerozyma blattae (strain ATCC 34711 / CBS 6284 / DSM 70876 / NBRC 10599 / NRRL Y-10934 / UCD 77-7) TaxID=1071380 RepID=I2H4S5_HENB6|nr:hypothetical protein TBLA_0E03230 [Tetrapisispora blattae CBS 6284]CCH61377.1 hypothetical protein TBLA_0E03230 [Tetrapisispora blattae CBS 6284]
MPDAVQLIGEEKDFSSNVIDYFKDILNSKPDRNDVDINMNYHIVSVFGSQSSGKSTLLNILFNTNFDTMDANVKRQQTTKGIWLAHTNELNTSSDSLTKTNDIFVLDVEGSDGAERGEDQDFERKAALFALAVSEVLIVNLWENQIGLYQGNNLALLKTVFEVNLSLFGKSFDPLKNNKVLLLFVIRDHVGVTPLSSLSESLTTELENIWATLNKPSNCKDLSLYDFFDLKYVGLAHKILQNEKFIDDIKSLGDSFAFNISNMDPMKTRGIDRTTDENKIIEPIFKSNYHRQNLPMESWSIYAENCWNLIENNKDLDLPTQQILVAKFKTQEFVNEALQLLLDEFDKVITDDILINKSMLIEKLLLLKNKTLNYYIDHASHYTNSIFLEKKTVLINEIDKIFKPKIDFYLNHLIGILINQLKTSMKNYNSANNNNSPFVEKLNANIKDTNLAFEKDVKEFQKDQLIDEKTFDELLINFSKLIKDNEKSLREAHLNSIINRINKTLSIKFKDSSINLLSHPEIDVWDKVLNMFNITLTRILVNYKVETTREFNEKDGFEYNNEKYSEAVEDEYDFHLGFNKEKNSNIYKQIRGNAWKTLDNIIHDYLKEDSILSILKDKFETKFRYDENDTPKFWKNEIEIDQAYKVARDYSIGLLDILSIAKTKDNVEIIPDVQLPKDDDEDAEDDDIYQDEFGIYHSQKFSHILNELQKENILKKFRKQINLSVLDCKRSTVRSTTHVPIWMYALLVVLGWNEFMMILRNPLYVTLSLLLLVAFYFINKFDLWGPVLNVSQSIIGETRSTIKEKLRDFVLDDGELSKMPSSPEPHSNTASFQSQQEKQHYTSSGTSRKASNPVRLDSPTLQSQASQTLSAPTTSFSPIQSTAPAKEDYINEKVEIQHVPPYSAITE